MTLFVFLTSLVVFFTSFFDNHVFASTEYGVGKYNEGDYSVGEIETLKSSSSPECTDTIPLGRVPWLYQANPVDSTSIIFRFVNWQSPVDHFAVEYGVESGNYQFAVGNIGNGETTSYTVQELNPNTTYFFRVRSGNGCATGSWSNELSLKTVDSNSANSLEISNSTIEPVVSNDLEFDLQVYEVNIKVIDSQSKPVRGAVVKLFSEPKEAVTDLDGVAKFTEVEKGDHTVYISYKNYEGSQSINLNSPDQVVAFNITVTIEPKSVLFSKEIIILAASLLVLALAILLVLIKLKRKPD